MLYMMERKRDVSVGERVLNDTLLEKQTGTSFWISKHSPDDQVRFKAHLPYADASGVHPGLNEGNLGACFPRLDDWHRKNLFISIVRCGRRTEQGQSDRFNL